MGTGGRAKSSRGPLLWPALLAAAGVLLLLSNFLLLGDFQVTDLWPLLLVMAGAVVLLRGDFVPSSTHRTFGITRGSVEAASMEISSGEIDVHIRPLSETNQPRLIAGQYASGARPELKVDGAQAHLRMWRSRTPWLSFADWEMAISRDLPWDLVLSSSFGQLNLDLSGTIIQRVIASTGIGSIHLIVPPEAFEPIALRSTLGDIHVTTPKGARARIAVEKSRFFDIQANPDRYEIVEPGVYLSRDADETASLVDIVISGDFGDAYLM